MGRQIPLALFLTLLLCCPAMSQDFVLQGCYWSCPEDDPNMEVDSATLQFWVSRMNDQAPELSHAGFSYLWLPSLRKNSPEAVRSLMEGLQQTDIARSRRFAVIAQCNEHGQWQRCGLMAGSRRRSLPGIDPGLAQQREF